MYLYLAFSLPFLSFLYCVLSCFLTLLVFYTHLQNSYFSFFPFFFFCSFCCPHIALSVHCIFCATCLFLLPDILLVFSSLLVFYSSLVIHMCPKCLSSLPCVLPICPSFHFCLTFFRSFLVSSVSFFFNFFWFFFFFMQKVAPRLLLSFFHSFHGVCTS